jgi:hypothetical protein
MTELTKAFTPNVAVQVVALNKLYKYECWMATRGGNLIVIVWFGDLGVSAEHSCCPSETSGSLWSTHM